VIAFVFVVSAGLGLVLGSAGPRFGPGPFFDPGYASSSIGFSVRPEVPFTWAYSLLRNSTDKPATIAGVRFESATPGLTILAAYLFRPGVIKVNGRRFSTVPGLQTLDGATMQAGATKVIVFKLLVHGSGSWTTHGTIVDYSLAGADYEITLPDQLHVCAPIRSQCRAASLVPSVSSA
jgi:hypothetical protein